MTPETTALNDAAPESGAAFLLAPAPTLSAAKAAAWRQAVLAQCALRMGWGSRAPAHPQAEEFVAAGGSPAVALACLAAWHQSWMQASAAGGDTPPGIVYTPAALATRLCAAVWQQSARAADAAVLDPAVGCGELLLGYLAPVKSFAARLAAAGRFHGWDLDAAAVAIARARLLCAVATAGGPAPLSRPNRAALRRLARRLSVQIRVADGLALAPTAQFDVVLANPPFQFLTGKASPVAQLWRTAPARAAALAARHAALMAMYPETSQGCRDLYKWFIAAAVRAVRPGGVLGLITPNTWLYLKHFRDVRQLLVQDTRIAALWDLGFGAFAGPTLGTAVCVATRAVPGATPAPPARLVRVEAGREVTRPIDWHGGDFDIYRSAWARNLYRRADLATLGALTAIAEGSHAVRRDGLSSRPAPTRGFRVPIVQDAALCALQPPAVAWFPAAACHAPPAAGHRGPRLLLRKTGAGFLAAPAPDHPAFAWAHQNLYVLQPRHPDLPVEWLALWLTAEPVQRLYKEGPHGQPGRPLAQLRVAHLQRLPAPPLARWQSAAAEFTELWRTRPAEVRAPAAAGWRERLAALARRLFAASPVAAAGEAAPGRRQIGAGALRTAGSAVH